MSKAKPDDSILETQTQAAPPVAIWRPGTEEFPKSDFETLAAAHDIVGSPMFVLEDETREGTPGRRIRILI